MTVTPADTRRQKVGILVERAAATLPATATTTYFTVVGSVKIIEFYGVVTTVCSGTATNLSCTWTPTSGTNVTLASALAITSFAAGTLLTVEGDGTALVGTTGITANLLPVQTPRLTGGGTITFTTSATNTGATRWVICYVPIESGSYVVAA
jgi:hypothetical protein